MKKWRPFCVKPVIAERRSQTVATPRFFGRSVGVDELRISKCAVSHKHLVLPKLTIPFFAREGYIERKSSFFNRIKCYEFEHFSFIEGQ